MSRKAGRVESNRAIERVRHIAVSRLEPVLPADVSDEQALGITAQALWERCSVWARRALGLSTTLGTFFVLLYFLRIGYLPIDNFSSAAALGGVVAGISVVLFASLLLLWAVPTVLIVAVSTAKSWPDLTHFFFVCRVDGTGKWVSHCSPWRVALFSLVTIGAGWIILLLLWWPNPLFGFKQGRLFAACVVGLLMLFVLGAYVLGQRGVVGQFGPMQRPSRWAYLWRLAWVVVLPLSSIYPQLVVYELLRSSPLNHQRLDLQTLSLSLFGLALLVFVHGINLRVAIDGLGRPQRTTRIIQAVFTVASIICLVLMLGSLPSTLDGVMRITSVRVSRANLVLSKDACQALKLIGIAVTGGSHTLLGTSPEMCVLRGALVLSRLGDRWRMACLQAPGFEKDRRGFNVDAKQVLAWIEIDGEIDDKQDLCVALSCP